MKTYEGLVRAVAKALGNGAVVNHAVTPQNALGQSGVHTFIDDIITIVLGAQNEADAFKQLHQFIVKEGK